MTKRTQKVTTNAKNYTANKVSKTRRQVWQFIQRKSSLKWRFRPRSTRERNDKLNKTKLNQHDQSRQQESRDKNKCFVARDGSRWGSSDPKNDTNWQPFSNPSVGPSRPVNITRTGLWNERVQLTSTKAYRNPRDNTNGCGASILSANAWNQHA